MINKFIFDIDLLAIIESLKVQVDEVLNLANLDRKLFDGNKTELSAEQYFNFCQSLDTVTNDPELSLKLGQSVPSDSFNPTMIAALSSENLRQALQRLNEFKILCAPIKLKISEESYGLNYEMESYDYRLSIPPVLAMAELVFITFLARLGTAKKISPLRVTSRTSLKSSDSFKAYFGISISLDQKNSISFSDEDLDIPFETHNDLIWTFYEPILRNQLSWIGTDTSYENRVKSALTETLPSGNNSLAYIANKLAMSQRSLQRYLQKESTSFQLVLRVTRHQLSCKYLTNSDIPTVQIAYLLHIKTTSLGRGRGSRL